MESTANPFADLCPNVKSEEDLIRMGVFKTALLNLKECDLTTRLEWCREIYNALHTRKKSNKSVINNTNVNSKEDGSSNDNDNNNNDNTENANEKDSVVFTGPSQVSVNSNNNNNNPSQNSNTLINVTDKDIAEFSKEEAVEYASAYVGSLIDRVYGLSLNSLAAPALRVLCSMLGIKTTSNSKEILYNKLANFYFTHCEKLSKRVSKSTFVDAQAAYDAKLLQSLSCKSTTTTTTTTQQGNKSSMGNNKENVKAATHNEMEKSTMSTKRVRKGKVESEQSHERRLRAKKDNSSNNNQNNNKTDFEYSGKFAWQDEGKTAYNVHCEIETSKIQANRNTYGNIYNDNTLNIVYNDNVFKASRESDLGSSHYQDNVLHYSSTAAAATIDNNNDHNNDNNQLEWSRPMLEKKIASIVQFYDPVTVNTILKKLAQIGYSQPDAKQIVESILVSFHQRQFIFYDNGIAYLM